jgi:uracil-DNA glycosylase family 4
MADGQAAGMSQEDLRDELCNWLQLLEISGMQDVILKKQAWVSTWAELEAVGPGNQQVGDRGMELTHRAAKGADIASAGPASGSPVTTLSDLIDRMASCTRCGLHRTRTNIVFGEGNPSSRLMFVGEGPGRDEDVQGRPFVGRAGILLTKIIEAMGLKRNDVYIANIVKCRPPGNRNPEPDEISECLPYLEKQVEIIKPEIICTLGNVATQTLTGMRSGISSMRGRFYDYRGVRVLPTFHPAACLRKPETKRLVWEDIKKVMQFLGLPIRGVMRNGPSKNKH